MSAIATSILRAIAKAEAQVWSGGQGFPPASLRAGREPIARRRGPRGAGEAPGAIFEELSSAIFAASCHLWSRIGWAAPAPRNLLKKSIGIGGRRWKNARQLFLQTREIGSCIARSPRLPGARQLLGSLQTRLQRRVDALGVARGRSRVAQSVPEFKLFRL
jgi:hypothetical protein